jgi:D-alanine-D-alanine ligase
VSSKNILLLCGGGGSEHEVSLVSVKNIQENLKGISNLNVMTIEIDKSGNWVNENHKKFILDSKGYLRSFEQDGNAGLKIDFAIPCIHGYPGETGDIQSYFEMIHLPYLGCNSETSKLCFNKISTKLWASALGVANTPYIFLSNKTKLILTKVLDFQKQHGDLVVKASNQGSSVGCYLVAQGQNLEATIDQAFKLSPFVLVEKRMHPRELEVSVYEFDGQVHVSFPGEIICPSNFYSYEEKYSKGSQTTTETKAQNLTPEIIELITDYSTKLFYGLKLRHLSRIDYFLDDGEVYLNEINTFPGLTPISMFPKMMEANGHSFQKFLEQQINTL